MAMSASKILAALEKGSAKKNLPNFRVGDTVKVHARIVEGAKERTQVFQGVVIKRHKGDQAAATFTVRKVSYNVGVERTFFLHSPRVEKIEVLNKGLVRRARLFYLRDIRGKASKIKTKLLATVGSDVIGTDAPEEQVSSAPAEKADTGSGQGEQQNA